MAGSIPSAVATSFWAVCGSCDGAHSSHAPAETRATAAGGSIGVWTRCATWYSAVSTLAAPASAASTSPTCAGDLARRVHGGVQRQLVGLRVVRRVRPVVPLDDERLAPLERGPGVVGDDRDAAERLELRGRLELGHADDLAHARHGQRLRVVEALDAAADDRRPRDHRRQHAGQPDVGAVGRLAGDEGGAVDERQRAAALHELGVRPQLDRLCVGHGQRRGGLGQLAEAGLLPRRGIVHRVVVDDQALGRNAPASRGRGAQHAARGRAGEAHHVVEVLDAVRAVGVLVAVARVGVALDDRDPREVGAELVGQHERQRRADALSHLGARADDRNDSVRADLDEVRRLELRREAVLRLDRRCDAHSQHQPADRPAERHDEEAPADLELGDCGRRRHRAPAFAGWRAAVWTASRMRW